MRRWLTVAVAAVAGSCTVGGFAGAEAESMWGVHLRMVNSEENPCALIIYVTFTLQTPVPRDQRFRHSPGTANRQTGPSLPGYLPVM
jgi:hypothetical protein